MMSDIDEVPEIDFSGGHRGAVIPSPGKRRITIRIDNEVLDWFREHAEAAGGGSYQFLINRALHEYIAGQREPLEGTLRRVLREEMARYETSRVDDAPSGG
jgi:hypothetical protein